MDERTLEQVAVSLDDIATTLDELWEDSRKRTEMIDQMRRMLERTSEAVDHLEAEQLPADR